MRIVIKDFRGIKNADISIAPIALIAGKNAQGKTSVARACAAVLTSETTPYLDVLKKETSIMINYEAEEASVDLYADAVNEATVSWKSGGGKYSATGAPPIISKIAAGIVDPMEMAANDFGALLIQLLDAEPTYEDLSGKLTEQGVGKEVIDSVWTVIKSKGFDAAHKQAKETGTRYKAQWEVITNDRYGEKKGEDWRPPMFDITPGKDGLSKLLMDAQDKLEKLLMGNAVSASDRAALEEKASQIDALAQAVEDAELVHGDAKAEYEKVKVELDNFPPVASEVKTVPCPSCQTHLVVHGQTLSLPPEETLSAAELKKKRLEYAGLSGTVSRLNGEMLTAQRKVTEANTALTAAQNAQAKLLSLPQLDAKHEEQVAAARKAVQTARDRVTACEAAAQASVLHGKILVNAIMIEATGEKGLRKQKMLESIQRFYDETLDPIAQTIGIAEMLLDENMTLSCGGTPYKMLSQSEQFRVRTAVQLAIAKREGAEVVIIDGADVVIDVVMRGALLNALVQSGMKAVICMAVTARDKIPDLADSGHGKSYWVEAGQCEALS